MTRPFKIVKIFCESYIIGCEREGKDSPGFGSLAVIERGESRLQGFLPTVPVARAPAQKLSGKPGGFGPLQPARAASIEFALD